MAFSSGKSLRTGNGGRGYGASVHGHSPAASAVPALPFTPGVHVQERGEQRLHGPAIAELPQGPCRVVLLRAGREERYECVHNAWRRAGVAPAATVLRSARRRMAWFLDTTWRG